MDPSSEQQLLHSNQQPQQQHYPQGFPMPNGMIGHPPPTVYYPDPNADLTGGLPISLDSLRDGPPGSKPFYPYSTLIRCVFFVGRFYCGVRTDYANRYAIKGSPTGKLLLEDIYYAIESRVCATHL